MKVHQFRLSPEYDWSDEILEASSLNPQFVLVFGLRSAVADPQILKRIQHQYPQSSVILASTAGSFLSTNLVEAGIAGTAIEMEHSKVRFAAQHYQPGSDLDELCASLAEQLTANDLRHVLVLSDGSIVNGTRLSSAFNRYLPEGVTMSGGLAGDGTDFNCTLVGLNEMPIPGMVVAIGFYGPQLNVLFGSAGGWSAFGPERTITRSSENVLYELDGEPALGVYKKYLGPEAETLPAGALRFPLLIGSDDGETSVVRTILMIDEEEGAMTFAGNVPEGARGRFMRASYEDLVTGAEDAAQAAQQSAEWVFGVSCVGRRIVLGQRTEEELEAVEAIFGPDTPLSGFYSYGELAPSGHEQECQLHNQTMTLTSFSEVKG